MHADRSLEVFDEKVLIAQQMIRTEDTSRQGFGVPVVAFSELLDNREAASLSFNEYTTRMATTSLTHLFYFIEENLKTYQSWHYQDVIDSWVVTFPFARYLEEGDKIINRTTGETYLIERVIDDKMQKRTKSVKLKPDSTGADSPKTGHRLLLEESNMINFEWGYIGTDNVSSYKDNPNGQSNPKPFTDTVTFGIIRKRPGGSGRPFEGTTQSKPRFRGTAEDKDDAFAIQESSQQFDSLVELTSWSTSVSRANDLVDWFETFFNRNRWIWLYNGIRQVLYWERVGETLTKAARSDVFGRPLQIFVRTEEIWMERVRTINCLEYVVNVQGQRVIKIADPSGVCDNESITINDGNSITN
jgi:PAS domain-containing protein